MTEDRDIAQARQIISAALSDYDQAVAAVAQASRVRLYLALQAYDDLVSRHVYDLRAQIARAMGSG